MLPSNSSSDLLLLAVVDNMLNFTRPSHFSIEKIDCLSRRPKSNDFGNRVLSSKKIRSEFAHADCTKGDAFIFGIEKHTSAPRSRTAYQVPVVGNHRLRESTTVFSEGSPPDLPEYALLFGNIPCNSVFSGIIGSLARSGNIER